MLAPHAEPQTGDGVEKLARWREVGAVHCTSGPVAPRLRWFGMRSIPVNQRRVRGAWMVLGFPVSVRAGFLGLVVLAIVSSPGALGLWLAGALAVLTLTHELGHAVAARAFGADASISLDLMAGYTSFVPGRPMTMLERIVVVLAGPLAEIVPGIVALVLLGANPLSYDSVTATDARWAIWWAGPVLGLFNLVPLLPLDGGMIVAALVDRVAPGRGRRITLGASVLVTAMLVGVLLVSPRLRLVAVFGVLLIVVQVAQLRAELRPPRPSILRTPGHAIVEQLLEAGDTKRAAEFGAQLFESERSAQAAVLVARCAARAGEIATAMAWLQAAGYASDDPLDVVEELEYHDDFAAVRAAPAADLLRRTLTGG
jgi:Zn-dependent protease